MKKWRILLIIVVIVGIGGYAAYKAAYHYLSDKLMDQVSNQVLQNDEVKQLLADPKIKQMMADSLKTEDISRLSEELAAASGDGGDRKTTRDSAPSETKRLLVNNKEEAAKLVLTKFSIGEIKAFIAQANRGMTAAEKEALKTEIMSKFTDEELDSLKIIALMEAQKKLQ